MAMMVRLKFDGKAFIPQQPVDVAIGEDFNATLESLTDKGVDDLTLRELAEAADQFEGDPEAPTDGAAQHDHYLYGTPKRDNP